MPQGCPPTLIFISARFVLISNEIKNKTQMSFNGGFESALRILNVLEGCVGMTGGLQVDVACKTV